MTSKEYNTIVAEIKERLAKPEAAQPAEDPPQPPHPRWMPTLGEKVYNINWLGKIGSFNWLDSVIDEKIYWFGNCFKTHKDASFAAERLKVFDEMREWAGKWDDPWGISYNWERRLPTVSDRSHLCPGGEMRFATDEDAENCIKAVGADRIIKYYFMIPESE